MLSVYTRPRSAVEECTRALSYWQDTHARLLPAIADYLNACACLHRALSQPALESSGSKLASALSCIDNSLPSLDQSALQLQNAQKTLRHLRNRSRMLAPINALPIEILTRIFDLAKSCVFHSYGSQSNPSRPSIGIISSVCSHWRKIALGASSLWNHIDLSIGKFRDANLALYAKESLNRAGNLPLYVHIEGGSEYQENHQRPVHLLAPFAQRIISLDLVLKANAAENIIRNIFRSGCGSSVQELYVCDEEWEEFDVLETGFDFLEWGGVPKDPLLPLKIFHLRGLLFEASSSVLKGLTELVLDPCTRHTQWAYSELHSVLSSCPKLRSLTLIALNLRVDHSHLQVVDLGELEVLDLRGNEFKHVLAILSWINSGSNALSLSLGIDNDQPEDGLFQLRDFTTRSHITRLCLHIECEMELVLEGLKDLLPLLEKLAFQASICYYEGSPPLLAEYLPRLRTLHFIRCHFEPGALQQLLLLLPVQKVQFLSHDAGNLANSRKFWKDSGITSTVSFVQCTPVAEGRPLLEWPLDTWPSEDFW